MTTRHTYLFTGTITTRAPLTLSPPDHQGRDKLALAPRMVVPTAAGPIETVYLTGSAIRGRYRHACADVCLERERPVAYERYLALKLGGIKGSAEERRVDLRERSAYLEREPLLSLFGAGASPIGWIHGRLDVGSALPAEPVEPMVARGSRGDGTRDPILLEVLDEEECARVLLGLEINHRRSEATGRIRMLGAKIARAKGAGEDTGELERELEAAARTQREAASAQSDLVGSDVSALLRLPGYEAIPVGVELAHRMHCQHVSQAEMGVLMAGLARFAEAPRFGARRAHGCGRVALHYDVKRLEGARARGVGTVSIDPDRWDEDGGSLELTGEPAEWLEGWHGA